MRSQTIALILVALILPATAVTLGGGWWLASALDKKTESTASKKVIIQQSSVTTEINPGQPQFKKIIEKDPGQLEQPQFKKARSVQSDNDRIAKANEDQKWRLDVNSELLDFLNENNARRKHDAERIGALGLSGRKRALACYKIVVDSYGKDKNVVRATLNPSVVEWAAKIDPYLIDALLQERDMRHENYQEFARINKIPKRLPWKEREVMHAKFAAYIGEPERKWELGTKHDRLNAAEMRMLNDAFNQIQSLGFRSLSKDQRLLILDAGAENYFRAQINLFAD